MATGKWTAVDAGIGGGIDSYFEYLVKAGIMYEIPELLEQFKGKIFVKALCFCSYCLYKKLFTLYLSQYNYT